MKQIIFTPGLEPIHWILAFAGVAIHLLLKIAVKQKEAGFTFGGWIKENLYTTIASAIMLPVILIVCTDTAMAELLPINKMTAFLAGYQTQSVFKILMDFAQTRFVKKDG